MSVRVTPDASREALARIVGDASGDGVELTFTVPTTDAHGLIGEAVLVVDLQAVDDPLAALREARARVVPVVALLPDDETIGEVEAVIAGADECVQMSACADGAALRDAIAIAFTRHQLRRQPLPPSPRSAPTDAELQRWGKLYRRTLEQLLQERVLEVEPRGRAMLRDLGGELAARGAAAQHVLEVHRRGLASAVDGAPPRRAAALEHVATTVLVTLMATLADHYLGRGGG